jgi:LacI family transcriptional regulator
LECCRVSPKIGRHVGADFKIVGFDDIEDSAQVYPRLSSIGCGIARFGEQISRTVINWLEQGLFPAPEIRTPVELIVRGSSR